MRPWLEVLPDVEAEDGVIGQADVTCEACEAEV